MTIEPQTPEWLPQPLVEFFDDEKGRTESAYIAFREGRYASVVQPSPDRLVFLYMGADDLPIGIRLLEPASGILGTEVLLRVVAGPDAAWRAKRGGVPGERWPLDRVDQALHEIERVNARLLAASP